MYYDGKWASHDSTNLVAQWQSRVREPSVIRILHAALNVMIFMISCCESLYYGLKLCAALIPSSVTQVA